MIRVVHLRSGQGLYGAERSLLALASATESPLRPVVVSLLRPGREDGLGEAARQMGLEAARIDAPGRLSWRALGPVVRLAQGGLLHAHDYKALWIALAAGAFARAPVVATFHGDTGHLHRVRAYEALAHWLARGTSGVAATSGALAARIRAVAPRTPIHVIPNGIDIGRLPTEAERRTARQTLGIPDGAQVVAFVGRLSPEKGPEVLLRAARGSGMLVLVAGDGPLRVVLEAKQAGGAVRFLGFLPDVGQVLAAADLLALPSLTEGLPMAVLEAMAAGVPVVASAVGSLPEVLGDGAGVLVPPGDVEALQDALVRLADPGPRHALAVAARARVESRYGAAGMARTYLERLYQPALESARGRDRAPALQPR
ncbi:MAG TPA: glycosyltransferase family 4 protein [Myxococcaceae bacterium]|nr:glycosyltransferase family 4 protein [Myxococcaceae bacterium]